METIRANIIKNPLIVGLTIGIALSLTTTAILAILLGQSKSKLNKEEKTSHFLRSEAQKPWKFDELIWCAVRLLVRENPHLEKSVYDKNMHVRPEIVNAIRQSILQHSIIGVQVLPLLSPIQSTRIPINKNSKKTLNRDDYLAPNPFLTQQKSEENIYETIDESVFKK